MEPYEFRRRSDGSIDFDFYRTGAAALRTQAMRDRATWRLALRTVLLTAAALSVATALVSATAPAPDGPVAVASKTANQIK
jgi:hypothetical protein